MDSVGSIINSSMWRSTWDRGKKPFTAQEDGIIYLDLPKGALHGSVTGCQFTIPGFFCWGTPWKVLVGKSTHGYHGFLVKNE